MSQTFVLYLLSRIFVTLAGTMLAVAVGWHIYEATGNPFDLALVGLMQILPMLGLFMVSGWVVDNLNRKYILIACTLIQGIVLILLAAALSGEAFNRFVVFGLIFLLGVGRAFYMPAVESILPGIVPEGFLARAVAISSTTWTAGAAAGPFVAGFLIAWFDKGIYAVLALLSLAGCALIFFLPQATVRRPTGRGITQFLEGIRYVYKSPLVLPSISLDLAIVLVGSVVALLPVFAIDVLKVGPEALGLMRAMPAVGAVAAGVLLTRLPTMRNTGILLYASLIVFAASILVFGLSTHLWLSLAALFVYGASDMVSVNVRTTIIQLATPDELRGRVNSVNSLFIATSNDVGSFRAGAVAAALGPIATVLVGGAMAVGVALSAFWVFPRLRRLDLITDAKDHQPR